MSDRHVQGFAAQIIEGNIYPTERHSIAEILSPQLAPKRTMSQRVAANENRAILLLNQIPNPRKSDRLTPACQPSVCFNFDDQRGSCPIIKIRWSRWAGHRMLQKIGLNGGYFHGSSKEAMDTAVIAWAEFQQPQ